MHYRAEKNERVCSHRHRKAKEAKWCTEVGYSHEGTRVVECIGDPSAPFELRRLCPAPREGEKA